MLKYTILSSMNSLALISGQGWLMAPVAALTFSVLACDMVRTGLKMRKMCK